MQGVGERETGNDEVNGKKFVVRTDGGGEGENYSQKSCSSMRKNAASGHGVARACAVIRIGPLAIVNYFFTQMCTSLAEELK